MRILLIIGGIESNPGPINNKKLSNNITIAHVNINSITATGKVQELTNFVDVNKITILALTETKLDDSINPNLYTIDNFHPPITRPRDRHGGGTAVYIHSSLTFSRISSLELPGEKWIWIKIKTRLYISTVLNLSPTQYSSTSTRRVYRQTNRQCDSCTSLLPKCIINR